ncbi:hypothetical protein D9M72_506000 [compost metagenome]
MNSRQVPPRTAETPWSPASGPDESTVRDDTAIIRDYFHVRGIDHIDLTAREHCNVAIFPETGWSQEYPFKGLLLRKILLGQRRAFVGEFRFIADYSDGALELMLS